MLVYQRVDPNCRAPVVFSPGQDLRAYSVCDDRSCRRGRWMDIHGWNGKVECLKVATIGNQPLHVIH